MLPGWSTMGRHIIMSLVRSRCGLVSELATKRRRGRCAGWVALSSHMSLVVRTFPLSPSKADELRLEVIQGWHSKTCATHCHSQQINRLGLKNTQTQTQPWRRAPNSCDTIPDQHIHTYWACFPSRSRYAFDRYAFDDDRNVSLRLLGEDPTFSLGLADRLESYEDIGDV
jgi:hypothetical protein